MHLREVVDPSDPEVLRGLSTLGARAQYAFRRSQRPLLQDELRRSFSSARWDERTLDRLAYSATDLWVQCMFEELLLGRLTVETISEYMRFDGEEHLRAALDRGRGAILVFPHAGAVMLLIARVALSGYPFTQVAARGFPPPEMRISADLKPSWFNRRSREAREAEEDRLPARFLTIDGDPRELLRRLEANEVVGMAFDGRGGRKFRPTRYLGRLALLSMGPWRLAAMSGAAVVAASCLRQRDRRHRLLLSPPVWPKEGLGRAEQAQQLQEITLRERIEPFLRRHPDHYARWLLHCRLHADMDDHPLFVDQANDDRWRRHLGTGF